MKHSRKQSELPLWEPLSPVTDDASAGVAMVNSAYVSRLGARDPAAPSAPVDAEPADALPTLDDPAIVDPRWSADLRRIGRAGVWALPFAAGGLTTMVLWGWPQPGVASTRPGTWLVVALAALALTLLGSVSLVALLAGTAGRRWAVAAAVALIVGGVLFAPMLGVVGLARPAVTNAAPRLGGQAEPLYDNLVDGTVGRYLTVLGLTLLAVGLLLLGLAVLASGAMARTDGLLLLAAVALAVVAARTGWDVMLLFATMAFLAAGLGLSWSAARVTADLPPAR